MLEIGKFNKLIIKREAPQGFYLTNEEGEEVLFPRNFMTEEMDIGDELDVIVYRDSGNMNVATSEEPLITTGGFACLQINEVNDMGAFCDWGVQKELFIPFSNQKRALLPNRNYVIHMYHDEISDRLVGSAKISHFLIKEAEEDIVKGQEVDIIVYAETELGYKVVVNQKYAGLIYEDQVHEILRHGQKLKGYVKPIRDDGRIDISLQPLGHESIEPNAVKILDLLKANEGFLPYNDKSDPEMIRRKFGISKKLFKKATGNLYKQKLIVFENDGVRMIAD